MRMLPVAAMSKLFLTVALGGLVSGVMIWALPGLSGQASDLVALSGVIHSHEEGLMEGVVVSARREGANFTVSVVSDAQGKYSFPRTHSGAREICPHDPSRGVRLVGPGIRGDHRGQDLNSGPQAR